MTKQSPNIPLKKCSLCGNEMKIKQRQSGNDAGVKYWVCSSYPECKSYEVYVEPQIKAKANQDNEADKINMIKTNMTKIKNKLLNFSSSRAIIFFALIAIAVSGSLFYYYRNQIENLYKYNSQQRQVLSAFNSYSKQLSNKNYEKSYLLISKYSRENITLLAWKKVVDVVAQTDRTKEKIESVLVGSDDTATINSVDPSNLNLFGSASRGKRTMKKEDGVWKRAYLEDNKDYVNKLFKNDVKFVLKDFKINWSNYTNGETKPEITYRIKNIGDVNIASLSLLFDFVNLYNNERFGKINAYGVSSSDLALKPGDVSEIKSGSTYIKRDYNNNSNLDMKVYFQIEYSDEWRLMEKTSQGDWQWTRGQQ